jgi:hypothetical protein
VKFLTGQVAHDCLNLDSPINFERKQIYTYFTCKLEVGCE